MKGEIINITFFIVDMEKRYNEIYISQHVYYEMEETIFVATWTIMSFSLMKILFGFDTFNHL